MTRLIVCLCLIVPLPLSAQRRSDCDFPFSFGPVGITRAMQEAGISEPQMQQIQQVFQTHRRLLVELREGVEKEESNLKQLVDAEKVDFAAAEQTAQRVADLRSRLGKATATMMLRMRQILTQDQWLKVTAMTPPPPPAAPARPGGPRTIPPVPPGAPPPTPFDELE